MSGREKQGIIFVGRMNKWGVGRAPIIKKYIPRRRQIAFWWRRAGGMHDVFMLMTFSVCGRSSLQMNTFSPLDNV